MQQFLSVDTLQLLLPCYITADAHVLASREMIIFCPINQGDRNCSAAAERGPRLTQCPLSDGTRGVPKGQPRSTGFLLSPSGESVYAAKCENEDICDIILLFS